MSTMTWNIRSLLRSERRRESQVLGEKSVTVFMLTVVRLTLCQDRESNSGRHDCKVSTLATRLPQYC